MPRNTIHISTQRFSLLNYLLIAVLLTFPAVAFAKDILVIPKGSMFIFWQEVCMGASQAAQENKASVIWRGPKVEGKVDAQRYLMELYMDKGTLDAIVLAPSHAEALNDHIDRAMSNGIKVVIIDSPVTTDNITSYIATDNYRAGKTGAELLLKRMKPRGKVLLMGHVAGSSSTDLREKGFIDHMREHAPEVAVFRVSPGQGTYASAIHVAEYALLTNPDIDGIFAVSEVASVAIMQGLSQMTRKHIPFIAFDHSQMLEQGLEEGLIDAIIAQDPFEIGYLGIYAAVRANRNEKVPHTTVIPTLVLTKESLKSPDIMRKYRIMENEPPPHRVCFNRPKD